MAASILKCVSEDYKMYGRVGGWVVVGEWGEGRVRGGVCEGVCVCEGGGGDDGLAFFDLI